MAVIASEIDWVASRVNSGYAGGVRKGFRAGLKSYQQIAIIVSRHVYNRNVIDK